MHFLCGTPLICFSSPGVKQGKQGMQGKQGKQGKKRARRMYETVLHGDFKAANLFLAKREAKGKAKGEAKGGEAKGRGVLGQASISSPSSSSLTAGDVAVCDFQFVGAGLGAVDLAYFLFPDVHSSILFEEEDTILDAYHTALLARLSARGKVTKNFIYNLKKLY